MIGSYSMANFLPKMKVNDVDHLVKASSEAPASRLIKRDLNQKLERSAMLAGRLISQVRNTYLIIQMMKTRYTKMFGKLETPCTKQTVKSEVFFGGVQVEKQQIQSFRYKDVLLTIQRSRILSNLMLLFQVPL